MSDDRANDVKRLASFIVRDLFNHEIKKEHPTRPAAVKDADDEWKQTQTMMHALWIILAFYPVDHLTPEWLQKEMSQQGLLELGGSANRTLYSPPHAVITSYKHIEAITRTRIERALDDKSFLIDLYCTHFGGAVRHPEFLFWEYPETEERKAMIEETKEFLRIIVVKGMLSTARQT
jgi:hypothetical protein